MTWPTRRFAALVGVSVKALRHYEKRGLIAPERSPAGYRRYTLRDLARLERVLAFKSLGLPLAGIAELMDETADGASLIANRKSRARVKTGSHPTAALLAHRAQLVDMRARIERAIAAVDAVERADDPSAALDRLVRESSWARWETRRNEMASPALRAPDRASPSRLALFHDIRNALDRNPSGAAAAPLADRWRALIEAEAEGNAKTIEALRQVTASRAHWPDGARRYVASLYDADVDTWERVMEFIEGGLTPGAPR